MCAIIVNPATNVVYEYPTLLTVLSTNIESVMHKIRVAVEEYVALQ